jgi:imidazolonepropionase-like amidohydrolase/Tol biopolymer transport system component
MDVDGSNPCAVTKEKFRLLNNPAWSPDSQYIVARKHFTSRRSLGAGEIWMYHRTGGSGLQLVPRSNDQKDLGEPAFSPDGRYVYYSLDATSGSSFEYNKDSNSGIYQIRRLDRVTGETRTIAGGAGGACRPTPSPDGQLLAFVRRVRFQSVLFIKNLESGEETPIYDGLDRDMQETWAIHGVYSNMSWTPDGREVVLWAGGKIRSVDVATKSVRTLPFRVQDTRTVVEPLRFPVEVCPDEFETKMLRWVTVSPNGDHVVFQALGHLWIRDLPKGEARRLTSDDQHFEHYPSFSGDGSKVVYVTWDDATLGAVREIGVDGKNGRKLTPATGHYIDPVYSPDGEHVVYRKIGGGYLLSSLWSGDTGLWKLELQSGKAERISKSGSSPHFGAANDRVFFRGFAGKRALKSIGLDGKDERTHLQSDNATEMRVSPDGKWVAFRERFNVYVLPFVPAAKPIAVGPSTSSIPQKKVTEDAGEYLHWSGDSKRLHWALGADLFTQEIDGVFEFLTERKGDFKAKPPTSVRVGFRHPSYIPAGKIALVGARLITMKGDDVIEEGVIIVDRNRIVAIGPQETVEIPDDAKVIDVTGKTIIPGFVDVHAHGAQASSEIVPQQNWISYSQLSFGVTTIHDPSADTSSIFAASEMARAGRTVAPRIFSTGTILYGASGDFKAEINSLEDARFHLRRMKAVGAISVKSYNQPRREQRQQVLQAARELEMMVVPEGGSLFQHNMTMVIDGHTGIEHCLPVAKIYDDVVDIWSATPVGLTPTHVVSYGGLSGEYYWYQHTEVWNNKRLLTFVPRGIIDSRSRRRTMAPEEEFNHFNVARVCKKLSDAGVGINLGAHGQREGLAAHWELWMLHQGGMTPHQALRSVTLNGARYLGFDKDIGSLEKGKLADLVVLEKNPLENIRDSEHIRYTMVNGRLFDANTLDEIGNHSKKREPFFFEFEGHGPVKAARDFCGCGVHRSHQ